ncbi:MAG: heme A synthase [Candidatus Binatia bacterium]
MPVSVDTPSPWPQRFAVLTALATLPLLFIGGLVTSTGSGLAVPDWPTTFGENMFLYPWSKMVGGIFYEHSHRLFGSLVGFLTILLTVSLWRNESRQWLRWLGIVALVAVVLQGILGGLRVVLLQQTLAIIHACFAQAFFALTVSLALFTSAEWRTSIEPHITAGARRVQRLGLVTTGLLYLQLIFGALLRHYGEAAVLHIVGAVLVAIHILLFASRILRHHADFPSMARPALALRWFLVVQLLLGVGAYLGKFTQSGAFLAPYFVPLATVHVVIGALMLVTSLILTLRAFRFFTVDSVPRSSQMVSQQASV